MTEKLVLVEDLLDDVLWGADEVRTAHGRRGVVVGARVRRPAALAADLVHLRCDERERLVECLLLRLGDVAV